MAKYYIGKGNRQLGYLMAKHNVSKTTIAQILNVCQPTAHRYICNPWTLTISQLFTLSGILHTDVKDLFNLILEDKPKYVNGVDRKKRKGLDFDIKIV